MDRSLGLHNWDTLHLFDIQKSKNDMIMNKIASVPNIICVCTPNGETEYNATGYPDEQPQAKPDDTSEVKFINQSLL